MAVRQLSAVFVSALFLGIIPSIAAINVLFSGQALLRGQSLTQGAYAVTLRNDCNLVLTDNGQVVLATNTAGRSSTCVAVLQTNGNFVLYGGSGQVLWSTNTIKPEGFYALILQPNRNVVLYGPAYWQTGTSVA